MPSVFSRNTTKSTSFASLPFERHQAIGQSALHRADVGVEIEPEAHPEEDVARVLEAGHARVAERARAAPRRTRVRISAMHLLREGGPVAQVAIGAEVELPQLERQARLSR